MASDFLRRLPHQIPFRAASSVVERSDDGVSGDFLWTANETLPAELMLVEAMAQLAGSLVLESQGFLSGIDACEIDRPVEAGDRVRIDVRLEASFGALHRFHGTGTLDGVEVARARFYLASGDAGQ